MHEALMVLLVELTMFPGAAIYNYTPAHFMGIEKKKRFAVTFALMNMLVQTACRLCPGLPYPQYVNTILQVMMGLLPSLLLSKNDLLRKLLAPALAVLLQSLPEPLVYLMIFSSHPATDDVATFAGLASDPLQLFYIRFSYLILFSVFSVLGILIWDRVVQKSTGGILRRFILFPLSQACLFLLCISFIEVSGERSLSVQFCAILFVMGIICAVADYYLFRSMGQLTEKAIAEERADWFEYLLDQQQMYYQQHLSDLDETARIRHDFRNQLQTAYSLMAQNKDDRASAILDSMQTRVDEQPVYCRNLIVNSILSTKGSLFRQADIPFSFDCALDEGLPLDGITLCSLFTNVLDNAYHEMLEMEGEERHIHLSCHRKNHFLVLSCRNPVLQDETKNTKNNMEMENSNIRRHGLGLSILQNIADSHDGTMEVLRDAEAFQIRIVLQLEET